MKAYKRRHQMVRRNWVLPANFLSRAVTEAYRKPAVDHSEAPARGASPTCRDFEPSATTSLGGTRPRRMRRRSRDGGDQQGST